MAAELIGTTIGVVGLLGQIFDGCVKAYGYFTAASNLDTDTARLQVKIRIEEMRLIKWGDEWGVAEGKLEKHLDALQSPQMRGLAIQILEELHGTVTDFQKLQKRYGLITRVETDAGTPLGKGPVDEDGGALKRTSTNTSERSWRKDIALRTKWVVGGEEWLLLPQ